MSTQVQLRPAQRDPTQLYHLLVVRAALSTQLQSVAIARLAPTSSAMRLRIEVSRLRRGVVRHELAARHSVRPLGDRVQADAAGLRGASLARNDASSEHACQPTQIPTSDFTAVLPTTRGTCASRLASHGVYTTPTEHHAKFDYTGDAVAFQPRTLGPVRDLFLPASGAGPAHLHLGLQRALQRGDNDRIVLDRHLVSLLLQEPRASERAVRPCLSMRTMQNQTARIADAETWLRRKRTTMFHLSSLRDHDDQRVRLNENASYENTSGTRIERIERTEEIRRTSRTKQNQTDITTVTINASRPNRPPMELMETKRTMETTETRTTGATDRAGATDRIDETKKFDPRETTR